MDLKDLYVKVECPYNPSHMISPLRMPYHLFRCRKNYPNSVMSVCPYNAMHEVKAPELKYHMSQCPNRTLLERDMPYKALQNAILGKEEEEIKGNTDLPRPARIINDDDDNLENWDEDDSPLVFTPQETTRSSQETARSLRRNPERRRIDSQLRIPQRQSIAASFASPQGEDRPGRGVTKNNIDTKRNNNILKFSDNGSDRLQETPGKVSMLSSSSLSSLSSTEKGNVSQTTNNLSKSQLFQSISGCQKPILAGRHLLALGRGRGRPALSPVTAQSSTPLMDTPVLSAPIFMRMGRGGRGILRPSFKS